MLQRIIATAILAGLATAAQAEPGKWTIERKASIVDSSIDYTARLEAENTVAGILEDMERPVLSVSCGRDGMYLSIHWPDFVERAYNGDSATFETWSIDGAKPKEKYWITSTNAIGVVGREARTRLAELATAKRLAIRVGDKHGTQEAAFDLEGIAAVAADVGPMRCG